MGLLVDDNGQYRGWLAAFLCCCAALNEDEYPNERERDKLACKQSVVRITWTSTDNDTASSKEATYSKQPQLTALPSLPPLNTTPIAQQGTSDNDARSRCDSRQSDPVSSLPKSFHFDPDYLLPQLATKDTENVGNHLPQSPTYDPMSPTRRVHLSRAQSIQKKGLIPLPLGPVVLRDPNDTIYATNQPTATRDAPSTTRRNQGSDSTQDLLGNASTPNYLETRETPYQRCGRQSTETLARRASPTENATHAQAPSPSVRLFPPKANTQTPSLPASLRQHARDLSNPSSHSTLVDQRSSRNNPRLQRKRSNTSKSSFANTEDSDVEKEVLELNTIVEERRAENNKDRSASGHVPAVAPSMQVRARSETLTDIGSALSRPLTASSKKDLRVETGDYEMEEREGLASSKSHKSSSSVPGWRLASVSPTSTTSTANTTINTNYSPTTTQTRTTEPASRTTPPHDPFPNHNPTTRAANPTFPRHSNDTNDRTPASASSSLTALDSVVAYTLEPSITSSPTKNNPSSKRYSRSLMITPLAGHPPVIENFVLRNGNDDDNLIIDDDDNDGNDDDVDGRRRRVGVAL